MLGQVHHPNFVSDPVAGKVDDDVVALPDALFVQFLQHHRMRHEIAVVSDKNHWLGAPRRIGEGNLEEARDAPVEKAEAVLAPLNLEEGLEGEIDGHHVAQEAIEVEDVEEELSGRIPGLIGDYKIDIVIEIAKRLLTAAGQPEIHAVIDRLVTTIQTAVDVERALYAFVHILGGKAEHVVVKPVVAHGLVPVAGHLGETPTVVGAGGPGVRGIGVDAAEASQHNRIVIIIKLAGKEKSAREPVVFGPVVPVVLMGRDGVPTEAPVLRDVDGKLVVLAEKDGLPVASLDQLGRKGAIKGPER